MEDNLGTAFWKNLSSSTTPAMAILGYTKVADLHRGDDEPYPLTPKLQIFEAIVGFQTPVEEKYADLLAWFGLQHDRTRTAEATVLAARVKEQGYAEEFDMLASLGNDVGIFSVKDQGEYCPRCGMAIPLAALNRLRRGHLVRCPNCYRQPVVLFWKPTLKLPA
jgi:hypothetical protein